MLGEKQLGYFGLVGMKRIVHNQRVLALQGDGIPIDHVGSQPGLAGDGPRRRGLGARVGGWILNTERGPRRRTKRCVRRCSPRAKNSPGADRCCGIRGRATAPMDHPTQCAPDR